MKIIESLANPIVTSLYKLHEKKYRDEQQKFLIEGRHLVLEAQKAKKLEAVLITNANDEISDVLNYLVTPLIINKLSQTKSPSTIIGLCHYFEEPTINGSKLLLLDDIQDPGNLGTLIRSALGFSFDMVIINTKSVDLYNDKFIRATQGALFHLPIVKTDLQETIRNLKRQGFKIIGAQMKQATNVYLYEPPLKFALLLGNEGQGIDEGLMAQTDDVVFIPMNEKLESLNVAIAGSIIMSYINQKR
jgi:TrmH family RNA methyltransferase